MNDIEIISRGTVTLAPKENLVEKLKKKSPLKVKFGADPTAPDLHLGHAVVMEKLREIQTLGHQIIFLIGDFTTKIGDPTGKSKTRPMLSDDDIKKNAQTYFEQVFRILDKNKTKIVYNSEWLNPLGMSDVVKLCAKVTLASLIEREDFKKRIDNNTSIGFHELLYPILQAYDSVALEADLELGGTDQTFNLLFGRHLQSQFGQEPQVVLTMPILEGLDGKNKMSKSLNNYVGLNDTPEDAFGKLMSMPDSNLENYHRLLLCKTEEQIKELRAGLANGLIHPMDEKKKVAFSIVEKYWGNDAATAGKNAFEEIFQKQNYVVAPEFQITMAGCDKIWIVELLKQTGVCKSSSDARRLIDSKAVLVNGEPVTDFKAELKISGETLLKVGKKVFRLQK